MAPLIQDWLPPSRETYDLVLFYWKFLYIIIGSLQWTTTWYGMGKTSVASRFNIPGRLAWLAMECPGFCTLAYIATTLPAQLGLDPAAMPWQNKVLAGLFVVHYLYRAVGYPLLAPSIAPMHVGVMAMALGFQLMNALCLGGWLGGYGPTTEEEWSGPGVMVRFVIGILVFYLGFAGNIFHDDELREIRRREQLRQEKERREKNAPVERYYQMPQGTLFRWILYPHYLCEWIEWTGFWIAAGPRCVPAMMFVVNEVVTMLPRAIRGRHWYEEKFGVEAVRGKWTIVPGII